MRWRVGLVVLLTGLSAHAADYQTVDDAAQAVATCLTAQPPNLEEIFDPGFLAQVPVAQLAEVFKQVRAAGGTVTATVIVKRLNPWAAEGEFRFVQRRRARFTIVLTPTPPHRVSGLLIQGVEPTGTPAELLAELRGLPGQVAVQVVELRDGPPRVVAAAGPDEVMAIGSAFKLYVLGALADEIAAGHHRWDETLTIKPEYQTLPTGTLQTWPAGAPLTIHTVASFMISVSDNTATDHLLYLLGRGRVEQQMATMGHTHLARGRPLLATRELFRLKSQDPDSTQLRQRYLAAAADERRNILDGVQPLPPGPVNFPPQPLALDQLEWFASSADLVAAMDWLRRHGGPVVREILGINPGLAVDRQRWKYVGFKGGSDCGVLNLTYLLQAADGRWFALAATWNNPAQPLDQSKLLGVVQALINCGPW